MAGCSLIIFIIHSLSSTSSHFPDGIVLIECLDIRKGVFTSFSLLLALQLWCCALAANIMTVHNLLWISNNMLIHS